MEPDRKKVVYCLLPALIQRSESPQLEGVSIREDKMGKTIPGRTTILFLAFSMLGLSTYGQSSELTSRQIVTRYIAARGGLEKIKAVRTLILRGPKRPNGKPGRWMARARPFYFVVGEPGTDRDFAEGYDGASWEFYSDPGLVMRTTGEPSAASRHTRRF